MGLPGEEKNSRQECGAEQKNKQETNEWKKNTGKENGGKQHAVTKKSNALQKKRARTRVIEDGPQREAGRHCAEQRIVQDVSIGRNLRRLRKREDLTQDQVASRLQLMGLPVTRGIYAQIETGKHHIPIRWLMGLKRVLHTSYVEMLETDETTAFLKELD